MIITQKLENDYKNIVENIKNFPNSIERDLMIGAPIFDTFAKKYPSRPYKV